MNYEIKYAKKGDLPRIGRCHKKVFPSSLASKMGHKFRVKMFSWYLSTDHTFLFFIENEEEVIGYCGGMVIDGTLANGSVSSMVQYTFYDALFALLLRPWLLFHWDFLSRYRIIGKNILTRIKNVFSKDIIKNVPKPKDPYTGLVVIGTHPVFQGKGYGSSLLLEFEKITMKKGLEKMILSVKTRNYQAIKSYTRNGWVISNSSNQSTSMEKRLKKNTANL